MDRVSIITPVFRAETTLRDTVASVREQTHGDWELWLVEDASPDDSARVMRELAETDPRIHCISLPENQGAAAARNAAISQATGR